jgi:segregation and condensation protein A
MAYEVHLDVYDGPFDLLLQLITAQQVDLYEIRLSDIVEGFLAELGRLEDLDLDVATEFLVIASTLVELKCRRLLPGPDALDEEEELAFFEARDYLLARLVECKTFTAAAEQFVALEQLAAHSIARRAGLDERFEGLEPDLLASVSAQDLAAAAARALRAKVVPTVQTSHVHSDEVSLVEMLEELLVTLPSVGRTSFRTLTQRRQSRAEVVALFLALLELYKRGHVDLDQAESFGELTITWIAQGAVDLSDVDAYDEMAPAGR